VDTSRRKKVIIILGSLVVTVVCTEWDGIAEGCVVVVGVFSSRGDCYRGWLECVALG
jgi:hypothetical protein